MKDDELTDSLIEARFNQKLRHFLTDFLIDSSRSDLCELNKEKSIKDLYEFTDEWINKHFTHSWE